MQRIDASYIYSVGSNLRRLVDIQEQLYPAQEGATTKSAALLPLRQSYALLHQFLYSSVFDIKVASLAGSNLLLAIQNLIEVCEANSDHASFLTFEEFSPVRQNLNDFEAVLKAELGTFAIFLVDQKNAMDTLTIVEIGERAFPEILGSKVPDALQDVRQGMRCIAFELPTAAAFHLHRANETVLKSYWDAVSDEPLPQKTTMGGIVEKLEKGELGDEAIRSSLRDLIRLHRNPTIHPEQTLENVEEAINIYSAIRSIVGFMLKEIPLIDDGESNASSLPPDAY